jgi:hypothetical protein
MATNSLGLATTAGVTVTIGDKGDVNGDGCVQVDDLTAITGGWRLAVDPPLDLDGDRRDTIIDIQIAAANWSGGCP